VITALLTSNVTLYGISVLANSALALKHVAETPKAERFYVILLNDDFVGHICRILALWC
jgi:hypothetical protein